MFSISLMTTVEIIVLHALCYSTTVVAYKVSKRVNKLHCLFEGNLGLAAIFFLSVFYQ